MPTIEQLSQDVSVFPNIYISPYGNDGVIPLYSSIPVNNYTKESCLPCVVCGNSKTRADVVKVNSTSFGYSQQSSTSITNY